MAGVKLEYRRFGEWTGVSVYERRIITRNDVPGDEWVYCGTFSLSREAWSCLKGCMEVGAEENPLGFELAIVEGERSAPSLRST